MLTLEINKLNSVGFCQVSFFIGNGFGSFQIKLSKELISASFLGFHIALYFFENDLRPKFYFKFFIIFRTLTLSIQYSILP